MTESKLLPVLDNKDLVRDTRSKALLVTNRSKLEEHRQKKEFLLKMVRQSQEIEDMKTDIKEIKELLHMLAKNK